MSRGPRIGICVIALSIGGCQDRGTDSTPASARTGMVEAPAADRVTEGDLDVRLEAMGGARPEIVQTGRNPFRLGRSFDSTLSLLEDEVDPRPVPPVLVVQDRPGGAADRAARRLRFIGLVDAPTTAGQIAVLSDGDAVFHGREGDTVDGRYRIIRIGTDSVEVERVAGGNPQVLRLAIP